MSCEEMKQRAVAAETTMEGDIFCLERLLCEWVQGQVAGVAQRHSLLKVRRDKNQGRCRWHREKRNGRKFRAQLSSRESGLDSKQPKKPRLKILQILVSGWQKCGASR